MQILYHKKPVTTIANGPILLKRDEEKRYISAFNKESGSYFRTGILDEKMDKDTGIDVFSATMPELIDIGIMGRCKNAHLCTIGCYQGAKTQGRNMTLEDYKSIIDQVEGHVFQVALGGAGSPDEHENFEEILRYTVEHNIVPNYTTSGIGVTKEIAELTKAFAGAVAVSFYNQPYTYKALDLFMDAGCKTNIHYVLSNDSLDDAIKRLRTDDFPEGINAVVFLLYKPVGAGASNWNNVISPSNPKLQEFFSLINKPHPFKIGFDSCTVPGIINYAQGINPDSLDTCEGGRWSCYIHSDMTMVPCSFDQSRKWGVSLRTHTIEEAWNSKEFNDFRNTMTKACSGCTSQAACMGGCPIVPKIVLCERSERNA